MIICDTIKGKGVSFMEGQLSWHSGNMNAEQTARALQDLKEAHEKDM